MKYKVRETENVIKIDLDKIRSMFGGGGGEELTQNKPEMVLKNWSSHGIRSRLQQYVTMATNQTPFPMIAVVS